MALRIAFREWDTFFLGTARRNGGMRSRSDGRNGIDHEGCRMADGNGANNKDDMANSWRGIVARKAIGSK